VRHVRLGAEVEEKLEKGVGLRAVVGVTVSLLPHSKGENKIWFMYRVRLKMQLIES
jgi:hypothetical protein